jgi:hypothetical protein
MPFDDVTYLRCLDCGGFVVEGEAEAHEHGCGRSMLTCRVCGDRVNRDDLRTHLEQHNPNAANLDPEDIRDQFTTNRLEIYREEEAA